MTHYGGMGGRMSARPINQDDLFELMVERTIGDKMREDDTLCCELWCALANVSWFHRDGDTADYSFRAAGDMIAAICQTEGEMPYMNWYCCGEPEVVSSRIEDAFAAEGWAYQTVSDM